MKKILILIVITILLISCIEDKNESSIPVLAKDEVFQYSIWNAFAEKEYEGNLSFKKIGTYGDFGLGTFNSLDGEMIALDGIFYKATANGDITIVEINEQTPFVTLKFFKADDSFKIKSQLEMSGIFDSLKDKINNDHFTAIKIEGRFKYLKTRSVKKQNKPYPDVTEVIKNQIISEFKDIDGTLVGFYYPEKFEEINFTGLHFHFISKNKKKGGHLLDFVISEGVVKIDFTDELFIKL
jgi:acetolactate decarboxylase